MVSYPLNDLSVFCIKNLIPVLEIVLITGKLLCLSVGIINPLGPVSGNKFSLPGHFPDLIIIQPDARQSLLYG